MPAFVKADYRAVPERYDTMKYVRSGRSGLKLPAISLGLWHNFGGVDTLENGRAMLRRAFDLGITHFDLANNYGPPAGSAEENFGQILNMDFRPYRDELVISTKAGYWMWNGPYGEWGSRKYLISSLDQSLKRMNLEYVDIFYHHRPDPDTPLEETMSALDQVVRQGKALYAGISNYNAEQTRQAAKILRELGTPCLINQVVYSMFNRWVEPELLGAAAHDGVGLIFFSPLAQGMLTNRYLKGIPEEFTRREGRNIPEARSGDRGQNRPSAAVERHRPATRAKSSTDGAGMGAASSGGNLGADRNQYGQTGGGQCRRDQQPVLQR